MVPRSSPSGDEAIPGGGSQAAAAATKSSSLVSLFIHEDLGIVVHDSHLIRQETTVKLVAGLLTSAIFFCFFNLLESTFLLERVGGVA